jgi:hypothetical protein
VEEQGQAVRRDAWASVGIRGVHRWPEIRGLAEGKICVGVPSCAEKKGQNNYHTFLWICFDAHFLSPLLFWFLLTFFHLAFANS